MTGKDASSSSKGPRKHQYPPRVSTAPSAIRPRPGTEVAKPASPPKPAPVINVLDPEAKIIFDNAYERCNIDLPFNPAWSNGTGLYDYAVYGQTAPSVPNGQMARSATPNGRKLIIIGTRMGNVAVFERHIVARKETTQTYCYQATSNVQQGGWFSDRLELDDYEMELAVGGKDGINIGRRIDAIWTLIKKTN